MITGAQIQSLIAPPQLANITCSLPADNTLRQLCPSPRSDLRRVSSCCVRRYSLICGFQIAVHVSNSWRGCGLLRFWHQPTARDQNSALHLAHLFDRVCCAVDWRPRVLVCLCICPELTALRGRNDGGQANPPSATNFLHVTTGLSHSWWAALLFLDAQVLCSALTTSGTAQCW